MSIPIPNPSNLIPKPPLTPRQKAAAITVAAIADTFQVVLFPAMWPGAASPFDLASDIATVIALLLICGFKWQFAAAFALEMIPGFTLFPTWTAVVLMMPSHASQGFDVQPPTGPIRATPAPSAPPVQAEAHGAPSAPPVRKALPQTIEKA